MTEIRWAGPGDIMPLARIGLRAWESAVTGWGEDIAAFRDEARDRYVTFCTESWDRILLAHQGVATAGWAARQSLDQQITDLWIDPEHQGQGVGRLLLAAVERDIQHGGFSHSELQTHSKNQRAIRFFELSGYRLASLSVKYSPTLQQDIPIVFMRKDLKREPGPTGQVEP